MFLGLAQVDWPLITSRPLCKQDSTVDVTIGPYETYEDALYGYKVAEMKFQ